MCKAHSAAVADSSIGGEIGVLENHAAWCLLVSIYSVHRIPGESAEIRRSARRFARTGE